MIDDQSRSEARMRSLLTGAAALLLLSAQAEAACQVAPFRFQPGMDADVELTITAGSRCNVTIRDAARVKFTGSRISNPPANGMARTNGTSGASYQPRAGFKGRDAFAFTVCYSSPRAGCSVLRVKVTVD
jgi:hypothetical protein